MSNGQKDTFETISWIINSIQYTKRFLYENVLVDLKVRDKNDTTRKNSPLVKAKGAIEIDCSYSNIEETIMIVKKFILSKLPYFK